MKLNKNTVLLFGICIVLFVLINGALNLTMMNNIRGMEIESNTALMRGIQKNLQERAESFSRYNRDWSNWDDTYYFAQGTYPGYVEANLDNETLKNLSLSVVMIINTQGEVQYTRSLEDGSFTESLKEVINENKFVANDTEWSSEGYAFVGGKNILLAAHPILTSNYNGPIQGVNLWVSVIDEASLSSLIPIEGTAVSIIMSPKTTISHTGINLISASESRMIGEFNVYPHIKGMDTTTLSVSLLRPYYQTAVNYVHALSILFIAITIIAIFCYRFITMKQIKDLEMLSASISKFDPRSGLSHIDYNKNNDLSNIVNLINHQIDEIKKYKDEIRENERLVIMGKTASMVGHDLRNPLQVVRLNNFLFRQTLNEVDIPQSFKTEANLYLDTQEEQTVYMDKIVSDIQGYTSKLRLTPTETDLLDIAVQCISISKLPENIRFINDSDAYFSHVMVDKLLMKRVFINLISNAIQAMPQGGTVRIRGSETNGLVSVSIIDTGIGISELNLKHIFEPFFTTKAKGTGLGLIASKRIVEAHKGTITIQSKENMGTTVTVTIPTYEAKPSNYINEGEPDNVQQSQTPLLIANSQ